MYSISSIILAVIATIINSIVFGYVASNSKSNKISILLIDIGITNPVIFP